MDKKKHHGIRSFLMLTFIVAGVLPLLLLSNIVFYITEQYYIEERKKELLNQANILSGHIALSDYLTNDEKWAEFNEDLAQTSAQGGFRILVTDAGGTVVNDSNQTEIHKTYLIPEIVQALEDTDVAQEQDDGSIYAVASIVNKEKKKTGVVLIADMPTEITLKMEDIKMQIYLLTVVLVLVVIVLVFLFARMITNPLERMAVVIRKIADGHLDQRVSTENLRKLGNNEIMDMAEAVNNMAEKLQQVDISRQQFVSNVSHELKTPLSSIKVLSESILLNADAPREMYVEFLQDITNEVDRMTEIINDLLTLVRLDQKEVPVEFKEISLNQLVQDVVKRLMPLAEHNNITLELEETQAVTAEADGMKLSLAVSNLVENAIKYTDAGGSVKVTLDCDHQNAFLTVSDTGIGMAEEELSKIFERFYRIDKTRDRQTGGTGLGLSITHSTVLLHDGSIKVTSKENEGTTFVVRIPLTHEERGGAS